MPQIQFKTNLQCQGCVAKVSPFLNEIPQITHWEVDTSQADKVLTIQAPTEAAQAVIEAVQKAGFNISPLN